MRNGLLWVVGAWLVAAAPVFAQSPQPAPSEAPAAALKPAPADTLAEPMPELGLPPEEMDPYRFWVHAEYLAWWVKSAPLAVSPVTGDAANPTQALLGSSQSLGMFSGFRIGLGSWLDSDNLIGWDLNFFALAQHTQRYSVSSDATGNPTLALPFVSQMPGAVGMTFLPIASPGVFAGNIQVASSLQLWGAELNGILAVSRAGDLEFVAIAGFRFVDLRENLTIGTSSSDILAVPAIVLAQNDQFHTSNQFYGAQIGGRVSWQSDRFGLDVTGKLAFGGTAEAVNVQGTSTQTGPGVPNGTFPGGLYAQTSNSGNHTGGQFGFIPSVELKFSWFITQQLRAFVGYDFLYWNDVVRPGNQIDRNINLSQSAVLGGGALLGPAFPNALFNRSDFWTQGLNVGLEFRF